MTESERPPTTASSRRFRRPLLLLGLVAVVLGLVFASTRGERGPSSPTAAVENLLDAIAAQDVLGAAGALAGDEAEYVRLAELLGARFGEGPYLEAEIDRDVQLVEESVSDDFAIVRVAGGRVGARGVGAEGLADLAEVGDPDDLAEVILDLPIVVVRGGNNWRVSPLYTVSEWAVARFDLPAGDFDAPVPESGGLEEFAAVPAAVSEMASTGDLDELLTLIDIDGARWSAIYREAIAATLDRNGIDATTLLAGVIAVEVASVEPGPAPGPRKNVAVTSARLVTENGALRFRGACLSAEDATGGGDETCIPQTLLDGAGVADRLDIVVRSGDNGWRLDGLGTLASIAEQMIRGGDLDVLRRAAGRTDLSPTTPIETGLPVQVTSNGAGYARLSFDVREPGLYSVGYGDRFDSAVVVGPSRNQSCSQSPCVMRFRTRGEHELLVSQDEYAPTTAPVLVMPLAVESVVVGDVVSGTATRVGPVAVLEVTGSLDPLIVPVGVAVLDAALDRVDCPEGVCLLDEGARYLLVVRQLGEYEFEIVERPTVQFGSGGKSASGRISAVGDIATFTVRLQAGTEIDFGIRGEEGLDIGLRVDDPDGNQVGGVNQTGVDGFEGFRLRPLKTGEYRISLTGIASTVGVWFADLLVEGEDY